MSGSKTYKFNLVWRMFSYLSGSALAALSLMGGIAMYANSDNINLCGWIFILTFPLAGFLWGVSIIANPATSYLTLDENGFTYKNMRVTVRARWIESIFNNQFMPISGKNNVISPLHCTFKYSKLESLARTRRERESFTGVIPILYFGCFTHKQVKEKIREYAPYLFGFLLTEREFLTTVSAMKQLIADYLNNEIPTNWFYYQYDIYYTRYILHSRDSIRDSFNLLTKHSEKIAYLTAIWNEIVKPHFPDHEIQQQQDTNQIMEIMERYKN